MIQFFFVAIADVPCGTFKWKCDWSEISEKPSQKMCIVEYLYMHIHLTDSRLPYVIRQQSTPGTQVHSLALYDKAIRVKKKENRKSGNNTRNTT